MYESNKLTLKINYAKKEWNFQNISDYALTPNRAKAPGLTKNTIMEDPGNKFSYLTMATYKKSLS